MCLISERYLAEHSSPQKVLTKVFLNFQAFFLGKKNGINNAKKGKNEIFSLFSGLGWSFFVNILAT